MKTDDSRCSALVGASQMEGVSTHPNAVSHGNESGICWLTCRSYSPATGKRVHQEALHRANSHWKKKMDERVTE
uniref:Uncharacterized protein n=2 Tax=Vespula TaxID=7451 RepID=A0A834P1C4_VESPE|nr:hypothetical protein H0235_009078 [Vespula pensylvanica]